MESGAGQAPDLAQVVSHWTSYFASMGTLSPLCELVDKDLLERRSESKDLLGGQWQGKQYSLAWGLCPLSLIVNKNVVACTNIDLDRSYTPQQFYELCEEIEKECLSENQAVFGFCLTEEETDFLRLVPFLRAFSGGFTDEKGDIVFDSSQNIEAFGWLRRFFQTRRVVYSDIFDLRSRFAAGEIALISDGPWIKLHLEELTGRDFEENFSVLLNPVDSEGRSRSWNYNHALCIPAQSNHKRYAAKVVETLSSDSIISRDYYRQVGHLPVSAGGDNECIFGDHSFYRMYRRQLENSTCVNSQNAMFEKAMSFCIDAVRRILFDGVEICTELQEKERYLTMLYQD